MQITFVEGVTVVCVSDDTRKGSNTGYTGIHRRSNGIFQICKGRDVLGWRGSLDEAIALRAEADERKANDTYDAWLAEIKRQRRHKSQK